MNVTLVYRGRYLVREALDLETLSAVLRRAGHDVTFVYDPDTFGITDNVFQIPMLARLFASDKRTIRRIVRAQPDVIIFSVLSSTYAWCREIAEAIKRETTAPIVFLGLHPSLVPERVMRDPCVDYTIVGEAEEVVNPLIEAIGTGGDVAEVGNLWYRKNGEVFQTHRADLVDLDALPLPDKDLFAPFASHRYSYSAMVSRGCPYNCSFCEETCSKKLYGGKYFRRKSVDTVMRELVAGKKRYRFREVIFKDSYLSGNKPWLRELMDRYRSDIGVPFKCFCTISSFDDETAQLLKEAGCYSIEFGLQTWNEGVRRDILNRRETSEDALRAFECCDRQRLRYDVDHMFNLPGETEEDHILGAGTYKQLRRLGRIKVHFLVYYPTADILEQAVAAGELPDDAPQQLADGEESDFYKQSSGDKQTKKLVAGYAALYKVLPLLPTWMVRRFVKRGRVRYLRWIPSMCMALLQAANAVRCGDLRFVAYLKTYPMKVFRTLQRAAPKPRRALRSDP
jgi:radical SAM superfamily enzyme YgiQ (UPF0313 family)